MLDDGTRMGRRDANFKVDYQHKKVTNTELSGCPGNGKGIGGPSDGYGLRQASVMLAQGSGLPCFGPGFSFHKYSLALVGLGVGHQLPLCFPFNCCDKIL